LKKTFQKESDHYYAILMLDGDEMGKWLSGLKAADGRRIKSLSTTIDRRHEAVRG